MAILEECCMASADMQWLFYSGEQIVVYGPLVFYVPSSDSGDILFLPCMFVDMLVCLLVG